MAPNGARRILFPTNPDLANILGRTDLNFEIFYFFSFFRTQISGFPGLQIFKFPDQGLVGAPSAAPPDHKVGEIQGTRTIPREPHQCKPCLGKHARCDSGTGFQTSRFPDFQIPRLMLGPGLGLPISLGGPVGAI